MQSAEFPVERRFRNRVTRNRGVCKLLAAATAAYPFWYGCYSGYAVTSLNRGGYFRNRFVTAFGGRLQPSLPLPGFWAARLSERAALASRAWLRAPAARRRRPQAGNPPPLGTPLPRRAAARARSPCAEVRPLGGSSAAPVTRNKR